MDDVDEVPVDGDKMEDNSALEKTDGNMNANTDQSDPNTRDIDQSYNGQAVSDEVDPDTETKEPMSRDSDTPDSADLGPRKPEEQDPEQNMDSSEQGPEISAEERELGVYEDEDESDLDEAVADLDLELEPEIIGEELVDSILRKDSKSATSTRKCRIESALSSIDEAEELSEPSGVDGGETTVDDTEKRPTTSVCETEMPLSRAKLNTPASASAYTDVTAEIRNLESRDTTRTQETREAVFRRALTLMSNRCTSIGQNTTAEVTMPSTLMDSQEEPFGTKSPSYFYIHQRRPSPMAPLKAWRGYNGNVYFEPINIKSVNKVKATDPSAEMHAAQLVKYDPRLGITSSGARPTSTPSTRPNTRQLLRSSASRRSQRQTAVLDRKSIITQFNPQLPQDVAVIEGQQDTGSLAMRPPSSSSRETKLSASNREKIVKGSVVQRIREHKQAERNKPQFAVSGDKFSPMYTMSPLLRSQTQYSHSNQRMTMNSPDPHHAVYDHLPPLDQIRASLRRMDHMDSMSEPSHNRLSPYGRKVTLTEELKPFIKYSPEIRAKYLRQIQYLT